MLLSLPLLRDEVPRDADFTGQARNLRKFLLYTHVSSPMSSLGFWFLLLLCFLVCRSSIVVVSPAPTVPVPANGSASIPITADRPPPATTNTEVVTNQPASVVVRENGREGLFCQVYESVDAANAEHLKICRAPRALTDRMKQLEGEQCTWEQRLAQKDGEIAELKKSFDPLMKTYEALKVQLEESSAV